MKFYFVLGTGRRIVERTMLSAISPAPAGAVEVSSDAFYAAVNPGITYYYVDGVVTPG